MLANTGFLCRGKRLENTLCRGDAGKYRIFVQRRPKNAGKYRIFVQRRPKNAGKYRIFVQRRPKNAGNYRILCRGGLKCWKTQHVCAEEA